MNQLGLETGGTHSKVTHIREEDVDLDDLLEGRAGLLKYSLQIVDTLTSLFLDGALNQVALRVAGDLTRAVDGSRSLDGLGLEGREYHNWASLTSLG